MSKIQNLYEKDLIQASEILLCWLTLINHLEAHLNNLCNRGLDNVGNRDYRNVDDKFHLERNEWKKIQEKNIK